MPIAQESLRDWHRFFGLVLTDCLTDSPFAVDVERDLSEQQRLDVAIIRRRRGRLAVRLPDGLEDLAPHNLITFKSHHEALDAWAMKELSSHDVAYRKLVSPSPSQLLPEDHFRLYAVCARFPHNLSTQVPWHEVQAGVYDCQWAVDVVRVIVAGQLPRQPHNALLHLFSASPELVEYARSAYQPHSERTSGVLGQLCERLRGEGFAVSYTMDDFMRDFFVEHFPHLKPQEKREVMDRLSPEQRRELLQSLPPAERLAGLPPEERLAGLSAEQIREYLERLTSGRPAEPRKPRRKK